MLLVGYCYSIRFERRLCQEVELNLAYRWFCRLGLEDKVPDHSTFSVNRHGRFRDSDILRTVFESVVRRCMEAGLVGGEGFAVDASVIEPAASPGSRGRTSIGRKNSWRGARSRNMWMRLKARMRRSTRSASRRPCLRVIRPPPGPRGAATRSCSATASTILVFPH